MHGREHSSSPLANDQMWIWMLQLNATLYIQFILKQKLVLSEASEISLQQIPGKWGCSTQSEIFL